MFRKYIPVFLVSATVAFLFAACGSDDDETPCADCPYGGGAVICQQGFTSQIICGPDQDLAAVTCTQGGGTWAPIPLCPADPGETGTEPGNAPWDPGGSITIDRATDEYIIDQLAFEELKLDPAPLLGDSSHLRELESGFYQVAATGELSDSLGWQTDDILLAVDGYSLNGLAGFAAAYTSLADNTTFGLTVQRGRDQVVLRYRVE